MNITLWGIRAQTATPGGDFQKYGGNTFCMEVRDSNDNLLVVDLGTGAKNLGPALFKHNKKISEYNILISSVQYDRMLGLPFFAPILFIPNFKINIHGPVSEGKFTFRHKITESMSYVYFPVRIDELKAELSFTELENHKEYDIGVFKVFTYRTNYLTDCYAYKIITSDGKTLVYVSSHENTNDDITKGLTAFCSNADIIFHDAFFWKELNTNGWGRSTYIEALERAYKAGVKKLVLYGLNPNHTDDFLDKIFHKLKEINDKNRYNIEFEIAIEGKSYNI